MKLATYSSFNRQVGACWRLKKNMTLIQLQIFKFMPEKQQWHQIKSNWTRKALKSFCTRWVAWWSSSLHVLPVHTRPPNNQASSHRPKTLYRPWMRGSWSAESMNIWFNMTGSLKHFEWSLRLEKHNLNTSWSNVGHSGGKKENTIHHCKYYNHKTFKLYG